MYRYFTIAVIVLFGFLLLPVNSYGGIGFGIGPFNFHIGGRDAVIEDLHLYEDPICRAMGNRDLIEILLEPEGSEEEELSRLVVEPYVLGYNKDGELILRGYHVEEMVVNRNASEEEGQAYIGGLFTFLKGDPSMQDIQIRRIHSIKVLENTDFIVRNNAELGEVKEGGEIVEVICSIL